MDAIVVPDKKIRDYIDGKFRSDMPEEYVRQTIKRRLVDEHRYLPTQIAIEYAFRVGSKKLALIVSAYTLLVGDESRRERSLPQSHGISHAWNDTTCDGGTF